MKFNKQFILFSSLIIPSLIFFGIGFKIPELIPSPETVTSEAEEKWVSGQLSKMTVDEKIAQSFMVACWSNRSEAHLKEIESQVTDYKIGGVIFFQGERENLMNAIDRFQQKSATPLLIGMDAEYGIAMRIFGEERFPYAQTIGAADDLELTKQIGTYMGIECDLLGIHLNFAPIADVNSNPKNPVIGFRAFGSETNHVSKHVNAFVRGMEETHVLSCVKHFPGHGDTDQDSHFQLPTVSHTKEQFEVNDFIPFRSGIAAGTSAVMVAHLNVPALDDSGTPSSLSKKVIREYLRKDLNFKGLVISDALNMKAVSDKYGKAEVVAMAYIAGCDILLYPESISEAIALIKKKVDSGELTMADIDDRCSHVLHAKYKAIIGKPMIKRVDPTPGRKLAIAQIYEKAITVVKNDNKALPINRLDQKIARISIGTNSTPFRESLDRYASIDHYHYFTVEEAMERMKDKSWNHYDIILTDFHSGTQRSKDNYGFGAWQNIINALPTEARVISTFFGNPAVLSAVPVLPEKMDACILAYENNAVMQERTGQFIMGAFSVHGKLQADINDSLKRGDGLYVAGNGRLKYTVPEELGISPDKLNEIDAIAQNAINTKTFPGCQVVVAVKGRIIFRKSYGTTIYENGDSITDDHLYDIASVTKIASSTMSLMKLASENKFDVDQTLGVLVPELTEGTRYAKLKARDMLTHQAGLTPWIPFYKSTISNGELNKSVYSTTKQAGFTVPVAKDMWISDSYWQTMLQAILNAPLSGKKAYEYSDIGYYFFNKYIQRVSGQTQDQYVINEIYKPLGLRRITYLPMNQFPLSEIVPTENDKEFRKQVVHGYVHDPGAAMLGGVGGHAGIFSTATDLAALMQVILNEGQVGDFSLINKEIVKEYTSCQFCPGNRRAIGFDRPANGGGGPVSSYASQKSFGHSGFTGTLVWADPQYEINYVFLSNRVYPDADNWKIRDYSIRTKIQNVIYEAVMQAKH